jgi:hypothetical protein
VPLLQTGVGGALDVKEFPLLRILDDDDASHMKEVHAAGVVKATALRLYGVPGKIRLGRGISAMAASIDPPDGLPLYSRSSSAGVAQW